MNMFFASTRKYRSLVLRVSTVVFLFSSLTNAKEMSSCSKIFDTNNNSATMLADKVYDALTKDNSILAKLFPKTFGHVREYNHDILHPFTKDQREYIRFSQAKLNDHLSFKNYIKDLLTEVSRSSNPGFSRENILKIINQGLVERGFILKEAVALQPELFFEKMKQGIVIIETDPSFIQNGHGLDTHLVQLDYISRAFDLRFGKGHAIEFYKFMGQDKYIWKTMFDDANAESLGSPVIMTSTVFPLINLK